MSGLPVPHTVGDFTLLAELGQGGSGTVWAARWGHREIALKVMRQALVPSSREAEAFLHEARRLAEVDHPSVVKVLGSGRLPDGCPYLVMERLHGESLAQALARGPLPPAQAARLFAQVASAVASLHARGLVHRDIKPENIMLVDGGAHAVLLDFGIAKDLAAPASTTTLSGGVRGTPAYMAPERFFGQPASVATDVYELAVTWFAMLSGRLPWADCGEPDVRLNPMSLAAAGASVAPAIEQAIGRALSTRAASRPASVTALLQAGGLEVEAERTSPPAQAARVTADLGAAPSRPGALGTAPTMESVGTPPTPWFAQRDAGHDSGASGQTPMAWQPTAAPTPPLKPRGRQHLWLSAAALAVPVSIAAGLAWRSHTATSSSSAPTATPSAEPRPSDPNDPWGGAASGAPVGAASTLTPTSVVPASPADTTGPAPLTLMPHLPAETQGVIVLSVRQLRASAALRPALSQLGQVEEVRALLPGLARCQLDLPNITDSLVLGFRDAVSTAAASGDLILHGQWSRAEFEQCLVTAIGAPPVRHGDGDDRVLEFLGAERDSMFVAFAEDGTVYASIGEGATVASARALRNPGKGPKGTLARFITTASPNPALWLGVDAPAGSKSKALGLIPPGADAHISVDVTGDLKARLHSEFARAAEARTFAADLQAQLDQLGTAQERAAIGEFKVTHADTTVTLDATVSQFALGLLTSDLFKSP